MKDGYGQSIRERKILKSARPQSLRKNNKKNQKTNLKINTGEENQNVNNQISNTKSNTNETTFQNQNFNSNEIDSSINSNRLKSYNQSLFSQKTKSKSEKKKIFNQPITTQSITTRLNTNTNTNTMNYNSPIETNNYSTQYKMQLLEEYIKIIKTKGKEEPQREIDEKIRIKEQLQNNIDILNANIRFANKENKVNSSLGKNINKENEILILSSNRASENTYLIEKDLPNLRNEIENMKININHTIF